MTLLIFSCNRALQLQTLLHSLLTCLTVEGGYSVHVLYAASDDVYELGYQQIGQQYAHVKFHRERQQRQWAWPKPFSYWKNLYRYLSHASLQQTGDFKALTEKIIAESRHEGVMFLTDDSLFTRPVQLDANRMAQVINDPAGKHAYSLRHGLTLQPKPTDIQVGNAGKCQWQLQPGQPELGHWTWRFSVDGHLYSRRTLLPILRRLTYANPNSLEGFVQEYIANVRPDLFATLLFDAQPSLVGFILNKVQTYNGNRSLDVSPAYLNEKLLAGYRLTYLYQQPATDFQPKLTGVALTHALTGERELITVA
ncbi:hypothetical protein J2I47_00220 [Fibrella sp. HMF5335]|uniref:Uncharacterized protein n=1 Tax=Fibrella rubiginis TaxID=2817060 RepID=A0A939K2U8_9BACT|nr:hypothetical protein [Fibrella rubiginis]MBO0934958.1 hypothetical protein [Fibrella rubiginis]